METVETVETVETFDISEFLIEELLEKPYNFCDMEYTDDETVLTLLHKAWKRWRNHKIMELLLNLEYVWDVDLKTNVRGYTKFEIYVEKSTKELESLVSNNPRRLKIKIKEHCIPEI